ncbi:SMP-30/gluconolactonase/LRE family protein [bacterium]|nr:SMP-30/gluconolactonase/LRE family protein [bacterium]
MRIFFILMIILVQHVSSQNLLDNPESVAYDAKRDRYLVSNKGSGHIIAIDNRKRMKLVNKSEPSVRGLQVLGDRLYAVSDRGVAIIDLVSGETVRVIKIYGARFLNDITVDDQGNLYVSDMAGNKIYRIRLRDYYISILTAEHLVKPNGLLYDGENKRLLVCSMRPSSPIQAVDCQTGVVTTVLNTFLSNLDGLARDAAGFVYFSSWTNGAVYRIDLKKRSAPELVSKNHDGPADIFIRKVADVLVVPNFRSNTVDFVSLNRY